MISFIFDYIVSTVATVIQDPQQQHLLTSSPQSHVGKNQNPGSISVHLPGLPPGFILQPGK